MNNGSGALNALEHLINKYGVELLDDPTRIVAMVKDLAPQREYMGERLQIQTALNTGISQQIKNAYYHPNCYNDYLNSAVTLLEQQASMTHESSVALVSTFARALGMPFVDTRRLYSDTTPQEQTHRPLVQAKGSSSPASDPRKHLRWIAIGAVGLLLAIILVVIMLKNRDSRSTVSIPRDGNNTHENTSSIEQASIGEEVNSAFFSSGERLINYNNTIFALEADGLYCFDNGKQLVYSEQLDTGKGFCTNGQIAYVISTDGRIIQIDISDGTGKTLFEDKNVLQIVGCDNDYLREISGDPLLYIGYENDIAGGWSWGVDLCAVLLDGTVWDEIDQGVEAKMINGTLLYSSYRSDVSPTFFSVRSDKLHLNSIQAWSANMNNNILYYAELARTEDPLSAIELHRNTGSSDTVIATITDAGYDGIYIPGSESDVIPIYQRGEDGAGDIIGCKYISLNDGCVVFPQLSRGEVFLDRCTEVHYFVPYTPYTEEGTIDTVMVIKDNDGTTAYVSELPDASSRCLLINDGWLYYLTNYENGSIQRLRLG